MNSLPSISIIIPVYQVAEYIDSCLESVVNQKYPGCVEAIIIDDCGTDHSMDLARAFVSRYHGPISFSFYSHSSNKGLSAARNTGIRYAKGDFILFLDSDDELLPMALSCLTSPLNVEMYDVIDGRMRVTNSTRDFNSTVPAGTVLRGGIILREYTRGHLAPWACNKLFRRQMLIDHNILFYEGIIHEDELWSFQLSLLAKTICIIGEETYLYKVRDGSITSAKDIEKRIESYHIISNQMQIIAKKNNLLYNRAVCRKIESFRIAITLAFLFDKTRFIKEYYRLRQSNMLRWFDYFKMELFHPVKQLRLFHYALPTAYGALYHFQWLRLHEKKK